MPPRLGFAKEWRPARRTESPVHLVPTVGDGFIVPRVSGHCERLAAETSIHRSAARTEILTVPAPAHACHDRWLSAFPVDCSAKTTSGDRHSGLQATRATLTANPKSESTARQSVPRVRPHVNRRGRAPRPFQWVGCTVALPHDRPLWRNLLDDCFWPRLCENALMS